MRTNIEIKYNSKNFYCSKDGVCVLRNIAEVFGEPKVLTIEFLERLEKLFPNTEINLFIENNILYESYRLVLNPLIVNTVQYAKESDKKSFIQDDEIISIFEEVEKEEEESKTLLFIGLVNKEGLQHRASIIVNNSKHATSYFFIDSNLDVVYKFYNIQSCLSSIRKFYDNIVELSYLTDIHGVEPDFSKFKLDYII